MRNNKTPLEEKIGSLKRNIGHSQYNETMKILQLQIDSQSAHIGQLRNNMYIPSNEFSRELEKKRKVEKMNEELRLLREEKQNIARLKLEMQELREEDDNYQREMQQLLLMQQQLMQGVIENDRMMARHYQTAINPQIVYLGYDQTLIPEYIQPGFETKTNGFKSKRDKKKKGKKKKPKKKPKNSDLQQSRTTIKSRISSAVSDINVSNKPSIDKENTLDQDYNSEDLAVTGDNFKEIPQGKAIKDLPDSSLEITIFGAKYLPDCTNISMIYAYIITDDNKQVMEPKEAAVDLDSTFYNPSYNLRFEVDPLVLKTEKMLFLYILLVTLDEIPSGRIEGKELLGTVMGVSMLNLLIEGESFEQAHVNFLQ